MLVAGSEVAAPAQFEARVAAAAAEFESAVRRRRGHSTRTLPRAPTEHSADGGGAAVFGGKTVSLDSLIDGLNAETVFLAEFRRCPDIE
jgi:hypothetical protein